MSKSTATPQNKTSTEVQKFTGDMVWVTVSQAIAHLTSLIILPALTKSYPAETYGAWVQVGVTVGLMSTILALHLETAIVRFLAAEDNIEKRRHAFGAMLWPIIAFAGIILILSLLFRQNLSMFLFDKTEYNYLVPLAFLWASMNALFSFSLSYLRAMGKIKRLSIIQLSSLIVQMTIIVMMAVREYSLGWIAASIIASEALFVAFVFGLITKEIGLPKPSLKGLVGYLAFSIPQIPSGILLWVISASDRYFITRLLNLSQTGIYSASYSLGSLVTFFYKPITFVLFPTVSRLWEQNKLPGVRSYLEYSTRLFLALAIPAAVGLYILSQPLLRMLTTPDYMVGGSLVLVVALGAIFHGIYQINVYVVLLVKQTKWLPLMIAVAAITNAGLNLVLIPRVGIMGAAISTIVSYFVLAAIVTIWARRTISYKIDVKFLAKVIAAALLMAICLSLIKIDGILGIIMAVVAGGITYALGLFLFRAFSRHDIELIKEIITGLKSQIRPQK